MNPSYNPEHVSVAFGLKDYEAVLRMALPHAQAGNPDAQCTVALLYECGLGVSQNVLEAERWLVKAAEQNSCVAWHNLGTMYAMRHPELKDKWDAVLPCYQKAKELGLNVAEPYPPRYLVKP